MNTLHEVVTVSAVYKQLMGGLRSPLASLNGHPELFFKPLLTSLVAVPVQGFFAYRIYIFTKKNFIPPLLWFISGAIQIVTTIIYSAKGLYVSDGTLKTVPITQLSHYPFRFLQTLTVPVAVALDILIAIAMTILLAREYSSTQIPKTSRMLQRLIRICGQYGCLVSGVRPNISHLSVRLPGDLIRFRGYSSRGGTDTYGFPLSTLPVSSVQPRGECQTLYSTRKAAGADDWKTTAVDP
ncbi:hypothetical protein JVU11DRAFT_6657 [Chiua virens]|nr:hypothetical protein JVU11DRAFT_6657 [Chiua virens]